MNWLDLFEKTGKASNRSMPMYKYITDCITQAIHSSQLTDNAKLPPERDLASLLKIDRSTVSRAYLELEQLGLAESHVGRGTFVRLAAKKPAESLKPAPSTLSAAALLWSEKYSRASQIAYSITNRQLSPANADELIYFGGALPTEEFYPYEELQKIISRLSHSSRSAELFAYQSEGHPGLRQEVRNYLQRQDIKVDDDELLIVNGSQQAIDLVTSILVDPSDVVLIEDPTYYWAICNFSMAQARLIPVPVDEDGLQVDVLEMILARHVPKLLYVMPTYQNPSGTTLSLPRRRKLLELARRYQLPILEDNFVSDLRYDGDLLPSLKSLDGGGNTVIQQGTFSKTLCPGLRLGWITAPAEVMSRLKLAKRACDLSTNTMAQAVLAEYLRDGLYDRHLLHVRSAYKSRRDAMCKALGKHLGSNLQWSVPQGGMFIWARLAPGLSSRELLRYAEREGVAFSPGDMFFVNGDHSEYLRLSFIQLDEQQIEDGITKLGKAMRKYIAKVRQMTSSTSANNQRAII